MIKAALWVLHCPKIIIYSLISVDLDTDNFPGSFLSLLKCGTESKIFLKLRLDCQDKEGGKWWRAAGLLIFQLSNLVSLNMLLTSNRELPYLVSISQ